MLRKLFLSLFGVAAILAADASTHRLATYNIRYTANPGSSSDTEGKDWGQRGPVCRDVILNYDFDVVGFQEVTGTGRSYRNPVTNRTQLDDLRAWLPDYELLAWDRNGTKQQEYVAIAFKKNKYELLDQGDFFISATPDQTSYGWDTHIESHPRRLGWVKLKDKASGEQFIYACTHTNDGWSLDGPYGSQVVANKMREIAGDLPVMVVADYNSNRLAAHARKGLKAYNAAFHDAALDVPADKNICLPVSNRQIHWTYNAFHPVSDLSHTGGEIDFQFYRGMNILERHIVTEEFSYNGVQYPSSDHFPVFVVAELAPVSAKTLYVDANAGTGDGSISSPFKTISEAVAAADIDDTIMVTAGEYNESLNLKYSVNIEGGYASGFSKIEGYTTISGTGLATPPVYANSDINLSLKNLIISGYDSPDSSVDGAILFRGSSISMENLVVENNSAKNYGGGLNIYNETDSKYCECNNITAVNCVFRNNSASYGGAWAVGFYDKLDVEGCSFDSNSASKSAGAIYLTFGAPESSRIWFTDAEALITNSSFVGNSSKGSGTLYIGDEMPNVKVTIANTTFAGNSIDAKGGLATVVKSYGGTAIHAKLSNAPSDSPLKSVKNSKLYVGHASIIGNHAVCAAPANFLASAINVEQGDFKLINSIVAGNSTNGTDALADVTLSNPSIMSKETYNIFSASQAVNFSPDSKSKTAASTDEAAAYLASMMEGKTEDGKYIAAVSHPETGTPYVRVKSTLFGTDDVANLTVLQRNVEREFGTDIDRDGTVSTQTKTDQLGRARNAKSIPGAIEFIAEDTAVENLLAPSKGVDMRISGKSIIINADNAIGSVTVADIAGSLMLSIDSHASECAIDLSSLLPGVYVITCLGTSRKIRL